VRHVGARPQRKPAISQQSIWNCINSLGGTAKPSDEYGRGYNAAIDQVLAIIEGYGLAKGNNVTFTTAAEIERQRRVIEMLTSVLGSFLNEDHKLQVSVGGNPNYIHEFLERAMTT
jgi:hypothetical protein